MKITEKNTNHPAKYKAGALARKIQETGLILSILPIEEPFPPIHTAWKTFASFREVRALALGKDELWALTWGGVVRWWFGQSETKFTRFASEHGLPGHRFDCLTIDGEGRVWVGGPGVGACYFDGIKWRSFDNNDGLPSDNVLNLTCGPKGEIWISVRGGIGSVIRTGTEWKWREYSLDGADLPAIEARALAISDDGTVWLGTDWGLYRKKPDASWERFTEKDGLPGLKVRSMLARDDTVWIGTVRGLCKFKDDSIQVCPGMRLPVLGLSLAPKNGLWVATARGVAIYRDNEWNRIEFKNDPEDYGRIRTVVWDGHRKIFAGYESGATRHEPEKIQLISHARENSLSNSVTAIRKDSAGRLWIGTPDGLFYFYNGNWRKCRPGNELPGAIANVRSIVMAPATKDIWVGGWRFPNDGRTTGLIKFGSGSAAGIRIGKLAKVSYVDSLQCDAKGNVWAAAGGTLHRYDGSQWADFSLPKESGNEVITAIAVAGENDIWCGTNESLWRFTGNWEKVSDESMAVQALLISGGWLWIGTYAGLLKCDVAGKSKMVTTPELSGMPVNALAESSKGNVWAGTADGLAHVSGRKCRFYSAELHGLADNHVQSLAVDSEYLWIGTANGLSRFKFE